MPSSKYLSYYTGRVGNEVIVSAIPMSNGIESELRLRAFKVFNETPEEFSERKGNILTSNSAGSVSEEALDEAAKSKKLIISFAVNITRDNFLSSQETFVILKNYDRVQPRRYNNQLFTHRMRFTI